MVSRLRSLVRMSAFVTKEVAEIVRQPRLILTLLLGPFLILLLFGIGYRNQARSLRMLFVVEEGSPLSGQIREYASSMGPQLIFMGATSDRATAAEALRHNAVDVVVLTPPGVEETLRSNQQAAFTLLHDEIDPLRADYVAYLGRVYVDEVNRRILQTMTLEGQLGSVTLQEDLTEARDAAAAMQEALQRNDVAGARDSLRQLEQLLGQVELAVDSGLGLLGGAQQAFSALGSVANAAVIRTNLSEARALIDSLGVLPDRLESYAEQVARLRQVDAHLVVVLKAVAEFRAVNPTVLVSPFRSETRGVATVQPSLAQYYSPGVVVLLLQHLAITFAALSLVRERRLGAMELFRVSPLSAMETLVGKYVSYLLFGGFLAAALTALVILALQVPMLGSWGAYTATLAAVLCTSLGLGFAISLVSQTDSQAVQLTMLVLLGSVFFSGFIMSLDLLIPAVRALSWLIPATYGILLLQDIMLRGYFLQPLLLSGLALFGVALFGAAWLLLRRQMSRG